MSVECMEQAPAPSPKGFLICLVFCYRTHMKTYLANRDLVDILRAAHYESMPIFETCWTSFGVVALRNPFSRRQARFLDPR